jgi:hypothetical protein
VCSCEARLWESFRRTYMVHTWYIHVHGYLHWNWSPGCCEWYVCKQNLHNTVQFFLEDTIKEDACKLHKQKTLTYVNHDLKRGTGWPDESVKESPKVQPNHFSSNFIHKLYRGKKKPKKIRPILSFSKNTQRKQSPNRRNNRSIRSPWCRINLRLPAKTIDDNFSVDVPETVICQPGADLISR